MEGNASLTIEQAATKIGTLLDTLSGVVLGQADAVRECVLATIAGGHVLLEGPPGTAKTLLVRTMSRVLSLSFRRIQFTPDLMPADITGVNLLAGGGFSFRPGPVFADFILADEINRAPAKTQAALLEAMQERTVTVDGETHVLPAAFTVFATQNPIEFEGTYPLPEAELDRFLIKAQIGYPPIEAEAGLLTRVLGGFDAAHPESYGVGPLLDATGLAQLRQLARTVRVEPPMVDYLTRLVRATREAQSLTLGASPRATVALLKVAQAAALARGSDFVVPDDAKRFAFPVLRHRVVVAPELELEGVTADQALGSLLDRVEAPGR